MSPIVKRIKLYLGNNPIFSRFLKNSGYMFSSSSISMALIAIQAMLAARLLGKDNLGILTLIISIATTVNQLFSFRMGEYVIRFFSKAKADNDREQVISVVKTSAIIESITSICAFIFLYFLAPFIVKLFISEADPLQSTLLVRLFGLTILCNFTTETSNGVLRITNRFKVQAVLQLMQAVITFSMITLAFFLNWGVLEVLMAYFAGKIVVGTGPILMAYKAMQKEYGQNWLLARSESKPSIKETLRFAFSTNLSATIKLLASESWPLWLGYFLNEGAVGVFKVAMSIVNLLTIPITPLIQTAFPDITKSVVAKKWGQLRKLLKQITLLAAAWTIPAGLFMIATGKWLVWLFGKDFPESYLTFIILSFGFAITNIFFWNRTLLLSFGRANIPLYVLAGGAAIKLALAFVVIPRYGVNGEAALLSGYFILTTLILITIGFSMIRQAELKDAASEAA